MAKNNYFNKFKSGVEFMDGRERKDLSILYGAKIHIVDFAFLQGEDGEYPVFIIKEDSSNFYFGNGILLEMLKQVEADGMKNALAQETIVFDRATSKKNRAYTKFDFVD